jgi:serine/threonine-protein kinase
MDEIKVPNLKEIKNNIVLCPECSARLDTTKKLCVTTCPSCGISLYAPMLLKEYVLYKPLGSGGIGFVFKAHKENDEGKKYAVKLSLRSCKNTDETERQLMREAETASIVGPHRNLVNFVEYGKEGDEFYVVFDFVDGERLDDFIERKKRVSEERALSIVNQIIVVEEYICSRGYLYRDLKPENIILEKNGNLKICDYGLCIPSKDAIIHENIPDEIEGSPYCIPPERILGKSEGQYSEIYSLGMILFHMLNGKPYFTETEINELLAKHIESVGVKSVSGFLSHPSPKLIPIIEKMISREPEQRYQDFASLKGDLAEIEKELLKKPFFVLKAKKQIL